MRLTIVASAVKWGKQLHLNEHWELSSISTIINNSWIFLQLNMVLSKSSFLNISCKQFYIHHQCLQYPYTWYMIMSLYFVASFLNYILTLSNGIAFTAALGVTAWKTDKRWCSSCAKLDAKAEQSCSSLHELDEWSASCPVCFIQGTHWAGGWVAPWANLDAVESNPDSLVVHLKYSHYMDWAILVPVILLRQSH